LGASPTKVAPGGTTTVSWANIANPTAGDWIGLYQDSAAADSAFLSWEFVSCTRTRGGSGSASGSCDFAMPATYSNTYEFRMFSNNGFTRLATSNSVVDAPSGDISVPSSVKANQSFQVAWSGVDPASPTDWMGLYTQSAPDAGGFISWQYLSSCSTTAGASGLASGSCTFVAPTAPGTYEIRVFAANGFARIATVQVSVVP
jgi:hypothetical protein